MGNRCSREDIISIIASFWCVARDWIEKWLVVGSWCSSRPLSKCPSEWYIFVRFFRLFAYFGMLRSRGMYNCIYWEDLTSEYASSRPGRISQGRFKRSKQVGPIVGGMLFCHFKNFVRNTPPPSPRPAPPRNYFRYFSTYSHVCYFGEEVGSQIHFTLVLDQTEFYS